MPRVRESDAQRYRIAITAASTQRVRLACSLRRNSSIDSMALHHTRLPCVALLPGHAGCRGAMQAQHSASAWEQLPLGVQQRILLLAGSSCARRVSKAWRDAFDDANDT